MRSHYHCWEQETPACGIKKEHHSRCCLCEDKMPMTNNNWETRFQEIWAHIDTPENWSWIKLTSRDLFQKELTKKDQEHKVELEMIANTIKNTEIKIESSVLPEELKTVMEYEMRKALDKFSVSILDSHINKRNL